MAPSKPPAEPADVRDLRREDLDRIAWSGSPSHLRNVAGQLDRRDAGVVDYLCAWLGDEPVCKGAIDYEEIPGAGEIMQLATRPDLEGRGLAQQLIAEAERRIAARGVSRAVLAVEPDNERALRLYRYLGYEPTGERTIGWEADNEEGWYSTLVIDLEKRLDPPS
jgi:ribosomal protein S18 acetylase RimI-like enzyme